MKLQNIDKLEMYKLEAENSYTQEEDSTAMTNDSSDNEDDTSGDLIPLWVVLGVLGAGAIIGGGWYMHHHHIGPFKQQPSQSPITDISNDDTFVVNANPPSAHTPRNTPTFEHTQHGIASSSRFDGQHGHHPSISGNTAPIIEEPLTSV